MSLILDALRRAEQDRRAAKSPIFTDPRMPEAPRTRRPLGPWLAGVAVLGAVVAAFGWWKSTGTPPPIAARDDSGPSAHRTPPLPAVIPAMPEEPARVEAPSGPDAAADEGLIPGTESVATLEDLDPASEPEPVPEPGSPGETSPDEPPGDADTEAPAAPITPPPIDASTAPAGPATEPSPQADDAEVPEKLKQPARLRSLREMPADFRADFPGIVVNVHNYDPAPARRFVLVDGKRYRESERLAAGPALLEIVPEGMVLEHRGQRFIYTLRRP